jgi:hypothetical protein
MIYIDTRKKSEETLKKLYPNALIVDVTSKATDGLVKLSPFYPHGDIPVPFSAGVRAKSVEGIWQGLKVFETADIDLQSFENDTMKNLKRTIKKFGKPLGHRKGVQGTELLDYLTARLEIYLPSYLWVLENKVQNIIAKLRAKSQDTDIVLLDYDTNADILNLEKPLSHASLVKSYVEGAYPTKESVLASRTTEQANTTTITKKRSVSKKAQKIHKEVIAVVQRMIAGGENDEKIMQYTHISPEQLAAMKNEQPNLFV